MSNRFLLPALLLGLAGVCGWAVAQQNPPEPRLRALKLPSHFAAIAAGQTAILLETETGRTWVMTQGIDGDSAWLPARKLDSDEAARQWLAKERDRAEAVGAVQREMARKLEALRSAAPSSEKDKK